jgi:putative restriction endonuclease
MAETLRNSKSIKSINKLSELVAFAEIDKQLFELIKDSETRKLLQAFLIKEYFPEYTGTSQVYLNKSESDLEKEILEESKISYQTRLKNLETELDKESFEQELFVRGGIFKKTIPKIYNFTCSVTGLKVVTNSNIQMVDACHIIPFSISQDDTIQNGISLCPNIHRAFDRGLLTINQDYVVRISPSIKKHNSSNELLKLDGKSIKLPKNDKYLPSQESLEWHRKEIFLL